VNYKVLVSCSFPEDVNGGDIALDDSAYSQMLPGAPIWGIQVRVRWVDRDKQKRTIVSYNILAQYYCSDRKSLLNTECLEKLLLIRNTN
jgi:hypothetical protein